MYNFDVLLKRRHTDSTKWDALGRDYGRDDLMPFWVADADFPVLPDINRVIRERADDGMTFGYTFAGDGYYDSIISWNRNRHGLELLKEHLLPAPGVITALSVVLMAIAGKGDKILLNPPVYSPFFTVVKGLGYELAESPLLYQNGRYELDFEDIEEKFREGVKYYILCSPHNPVGRVWSGEELKRLTALCREYGVLIISDEIHYDIVYPGHRHTSILQVDEDAIMITAPSKTFNIAGLKSSVIMIKNEKLRRKVEEFAASMHLYINLFAYRATETAYVKGGPWVDEMISYLDGNARFVLDYVKEYLPEVKAAMPESTYLMWMDFSGYRFTEEELFHKMRDEAKVALNFGSEYGRGYEQFLRLNIACPRAYLEEGMEHIRKALTT